MRVPKGYKGRRPLPSELYYCARCQRYHLYESQIGEEHAVFRDDEMRPRTKEGYLLHRIRTPRSPNRPTEEVKKKSKP